MSSRNFGIMMIFVAKIEIETKPFYVLIMAM